MFCFDSQKMYNFASQIKQQLCMRTTKDIVFPRKITEIRWEGGDNQQKGEYVFHKFI